jgi:lactate dehydrogenase-like 2-hydroxyacid dehydrogenase
MPNARPRVLVTESEYRKAEARFVSASGLECVRAPDAEAQLASAIREAHASHAIVGPATYSGALYEALPAGGVIARFGVGHDGIDKIRATASGLLCTNTPGVLNQSVAEHTMVLIAAAARALVTLSTSLARGVWDPVVGEELQGKTLAIIGCGGIGRTVARIASLGYGMQVVGCSRPDLPPPAQLPHFSVVVNDFATAVRGADFVSLHMAAVPDNIHFINSDRLGRVGARAWLINTAPGPLIDERALFAALASRRLGGAALDVFVHEPYVPMEGSGDFRSLANVILTPHVASNTAAANSRMADRALRNIAFAESRAFAEMDLLNPEVIP